MMSLEIFSLAGRVALITGGNGGIGRAMALGLQQAGARVAVTWREQFRRKTPAGCWGTGADLVGAAVFLASAASDFVTGVCLPVDGGYAISDRFSDA